MIQFRRLPELDQLEVLHARYSAQPLPGHSHASFAIGVIEAGAAHVQSHGAPAAAPAGNLMLLAPEEIHTFQAFEAPGWTCRMFYPSTALMRRALNELGHEAAQVRFSHITVADAELAMAVRRLTHTLLHSPSALERESRLVWTLAQIAARHTDTHIALPATMREPAAVAQLRAYLDTHYADEVTLDTLATVAHLSPFHLLRVFRDHVGVPPHAYLIQRRVRAARALLLDGHPIAEVALAVGFTDQSHLNQHFRRVIGLPPGQYRKGSKNLQE
jgi:AraC-like DNA-binding protein